MLQVTNLEGIEWNLILKCKVKTGAKKRKKVILIFLYAQQVHDCGFIEYLMYQPNYLL